MFLFVTFCFDTMQTAISTLFSSIWHHLCQNSLAVSIILSLSLSLSLWHSREYNKKFQYLQYFTEKIFRRFDTFTCAKRFSLYLQKAARHYLDWHGLQTRASNHF
jgi:hypothetical protein